jgi:serine/threonine protein kinase
MEDPGIVRRFLATLTRLYTTGPQTDADAEVLSQISSSASQPSPRKEQPLIYDEQRKAQWAWVMNGFTTYSSVANGLKAFGYQELAKDKGPTIVEGANATIRIAIKMPKKEPIPLESRHLAITKIDKLEDRFMMIWTEVQVLRGCVHPNIIGFEGMFAVDPKKGGDGKISRQRVNQLPTEDPAAVNAADLHPPYPDDERMFYILLEYASAGDLKKEIKRYKAPGDAKTVAFIPELGALYYMKQICAGIKYLHDHRIIHHDLHAGNILLKYNSDGTKKCLVCDFGLAELMKPKEAVRPWTFRTDTWKVAKLAWFMMRDKSQWSDQAKEVCTVGDFGQGRVNINNIDQLMALSWFKKKGVPPIPKSMTALLDAQVVKDTGYLPPLDPAGTIHPPTPVPRRRRGETRGSQVSTGSYRRTRTPSPTPAAASTSGLQPAPQESQARPSIYQRFRDTVTSIPSRIRSVTGRQEIAGRSDLEQSTESSGKYTPRKKSPSQEF